MSYPCTDSDVAHPVSMSDILEDLADRADL